MYFLLYRNIGNEHSKVDSIVKYLLYVHCILIN